MVSSRELKNSWCPRYLFDVKRQKGSFLSKLQKCSITKGRLVIELKCKMSEAASLWTLILNSASDYAVEEKTVMASLENDENYILKENLLSIASKKPLPSSWNTPSIYQKENYPETNKTTNSKLASESFPKFSTKLTELSKISLEDLISVPIPF